MKRVSNVLKVISILALIAAFINKNYSVARLIFIVSSIVLFTISYIYAKKRSYVNVVLCFLMCLLITYFIDFSFTYIFKYNPIYSIKIKSSDNFITYNSVLYRQFDCNKKYFDLMYSKSSYCSYKTLEEKDINTISSDIVNSFDEYKDKFYLINAKVSYKEGDSIIEFKSYTEDLESINGNVTFNDNIIYKCKLDDTKDIKLYDTIHIVGRIASINKIDDYYEVEIKDAYIPKIAKTKIYKDYKINVVENKKCNADKTLYVKTQDYKYYTSCLDNIYVVYDEVDVYELSYVLKDEKITLDELLKNYNEKENSENEDNYTLYKFDNYNIVDCNNKSIIIGNKKLTLENNYCKAKDTDKNEL